MAMTVTRRVVLSITITCVAWPAFAQKPVRDTVISTLYQEPPDTPNGLYNAAQAIVVVRVSAGHGVASLTAPSKVFTDVTGTILQIVKAGPQIGPVGAEVSFRVTGGELDRGDHVARTIAPGQPKLLPGHDYLVALTWNEQEVAFFPTFGPGSIFSVTNGVVKPQRNTALGAKLNGLPLRQLIAQLTNVPSPPK